LENILKFLYLTAVIAVGATLPIKANDNLTLSKVIDQFLEIEADNKVLAIAYNADGHWVSGWQAYCKERVISRLDVIDLALKRCELEAESSQFEGLTPCEVVFEGKENITLIPEILTHS
jgi:hypothetical protein